MYTETQELDQDLRKLMLRAIESNLCVLDSEDKSSQNEPTQKLFDLVAEVTSDYKMQVDTVYGNVPDSINLNGLEKVDVNQELLDKFFDENLGLVPRGKKYILVFEGHNHQILGAY